MRRGTRAALLSCLVVAAGCIGTPGAGGSATASSAEDLTESTAPLSPTQLTKTPTPWTETETRTDRETEADTETPPLTTAREDVTVEYLVRAGSIPDEFESVTVEFEVAFSERVDEVRKCTGLLFDSEYDPTPTPLSTPVGDCHRESGITVDLTELDGARSLGTFTAPGRFDGEHSLVVKDVVPVYENGTTVTEIHDTDFRAHHSTDAAHGPYAVEISIHGTGPDSNAAWAYSVEERDSDPETETTE